MYHSGYDCRLETVISAGVSQSSDEDEIVQYTGAHGDQVNRVGVLKHRCHEETARFGEQRRHPLISDRILASHNCVSDIQHIVSSTANIQSNQELFIMTCPRRHDTVRIAQTRRANAGSV